MTINPDEDALAGLGQMTDTLDAIYRLRLQGPDTVLGVLNEIKAEQAFEQKIADREKGLQDLNAQTDAVRQEIDALTKDRKNRSWMGLGGLKGQAAQDFAEKSKKLERIQSAARITAEDLEKLNDPANRPPTQYDQFAAEKEKLRELLDITPDEHKKRQQDLIKAAQDFVDTSQQRIAAVLAGLNGAAGEAAAQAVAQEQETMRIAAATSAWGAQGCPTTAPVRVMRPLKVRHAGFTTL